MNETKQEYINSADNSRKSILARGCDPFASLQASKAIPPLIGNPEYVPTTNDADFIEKLRSRDWSVIFFAPGACRFSAAKQPIPSGNSQTQGWTLEQYRVWSGNIKATRYKLLRHRKRERPSVYSKAR